MANFEFVKYEATPGEKHLGVATVKMYGKILLRFKIVENKNGGWFPCSGSYKVGSVDGKDKYVQAFQIDSSSEKDELDDFIRHHVHTAMNRPNSNGNGAPSALGYAPNTSTVPPFPASFYSHPETSISATPEFAPELPLGW